MGTLAWETVAPEFAFDGSWRDIYVFDTDLQAWQRVLDRLRQGDYEFVYRRSGNVSELPVTAADAFPVDGEADRMLSVTFCDVLANCHFFTPDEIEFDIDPREVQGQGQLDSLLAFIRLLSDAAGKDAVLTPENCREILVFRSRPGQSAVEYHEFGGWRSAE
ncbi:hypothetical protein NA78x_002130 [Anatilimnocola sp. NA78]|uniref:hypothetical protein n=1 Tax=Anatilimnocola sp. NA78 TaxID=3415683 RepID=UPI003CE56E11